MSLSGITVKSPMFDQLQTAERDNDVFYSVNVRNLSQVFSPTVISLLPKDKEEINY